MNFQPKFNYPCFYPYRSGDVVLIRASVLDCPYGTVRVQITGQALDVSPDDVDAVEAFAHRVGDRVVPAECPVPGVVLAVDGIEVWVRHEDGNRKTWDAVDLLRIQPTAAMEPAA